MTDPITLEIPHKLGRAQARERIDKGSAQFAAIVPGATVKAHRWDGDILSFTLEAMGQSVATQIEVLDDRVRAIVDLPPMLALIAGRIGEKLLGAGAKLLR
jgi:hypothetical protein